MSRADALAAVLTPACREHFGEGAAVEGLRRLTGGASQETWAFDLRLLDGSERPMILRKDRPGPGFGIDRRGEYELLRVAHPAGARVPQAHFFLEDAGGGAAYVMDRIPGETIPRKILREPGLENARTRLAEQCGEELARIHAVDPEPVPALPRPPGQSTPASDQRTTLLQLYDALGEPHPALELGFRWLADREPPCERRTLVHGDFRNGNLVVGPDGLNAVLDWELAHVGDPMEDLGWLCVRSWRFGNDDRPVGGFGKRETLFQAYERGSGHRVDPEIVRYWEAFGTLKWGVICMMQAAAHYQGVQPSVELAAIGRRTCEAEWDLLQLIA